MSLAQNFDGDWLALRGAIRQLLSFVDKGRAAGQINTAHGYLYLLDPGELDLLIQQVRDQIPDQTVPAPAITGLNPNQGLAGMDTEVEISGSNFVAGAVVNLGSAYGLVPDQLTATQISVLFAAQNLGQPGDLTVSVQNTDGQISNQLVFSVVSELKDLKKEPPHKKEEKAEYVGAKAEVKGEAKSHHGK